MDTQDTEQRSRLMRPDEASHYLKLEHGINMQASTLGKLRCVGGGPRFHRSGRWPIYDIADLDEWAKARRTRKAASTSELPPMYAKRERDRAAA